MQKKVFMAKKPYKTIEMNLCLGCSYSLDARKKVLKVLQNPYSIGLFQNGSHLMLILNNVLTYDFVFLKFGTNIGQLRTSWAKISTGSGCKCDIIEMKHRFSFQNTVIPTKSMEH